MRVQFLHGGHNALWHTGSAHCCAIDLLEALVTKGEDTECHDECKTGENSFNEANQQGVGFGVGGTIFHHLESMFSGGVGSSTHASFGHHLQQKISSF